MTLGFLLLQSYCFFTVRARFVQKFRTSGRLLFRYFFMHVKIIRPVRLKEFPTVHLDFFYAYENIFLCL